MMIQSQERWLKNATARPVMFSRLEELDEGIVLRGDTFIIKEDGKELPVCTTSEIKLLGSHNHENYSGSYRHNILYGSYL